MQAQPQPMPQIDSVELSLTDNPPDVIADIAAYFQGRETEVESKIRRKERVWKARKLKGGWETWLQVELAIMLDDECSVYFSREEAIYNNPLQRIDLWGEPTWDSHTQEASRVDTIGIELKCEYAGNKSRDWHAEDERNSPRTAFLEDVVKVLAGINPQCKGKGEGCETRGTTIYCIAVTTKERDLYDLGYQAKPELLAIVGGQTFYHTKILDEAGYNMWDNPLPNEGHEDLWLLWWACHFPRPDELKGTILPPPPPHPSGKLPPIGTFYNTHYPVHASESS